MQGLSNAVFPSRVLNRLVSAYKHLDFAEIALEIPNTPHEAEKELLASFPGVPKCA